MATITVSLPSDGDTIDAADYNTPITTIVDEINGGIDADNLASNAVTTAKITDANVTNAKLSADAKNLNKIISSTRDAGAASGDVSYTGVGFTPTSVRAILVVDNTTYNSDGSSDSSKASSCIYTSASNVFYANATSLVSYSNQSSWAQTAVVKSYDADGFTLTWTKVGTPTAGTIKLIFMCSR